MRRNSVRATGRPVWVTARPHGDGRLVLVARSSLAADSTLAAPKLVGSEDLMTLRGGTSSTCASAHVLVLDGGMMTLDLVRLLAVCRTPPESRRKLPKRGVRRRTEDEVLGELSRPDAPYV